VGKSSAYLLNVTTDSLTTLTKETSMKTLITTLAVASLVATSAIAKTQVHTKHVDRSDIYQSDSLGYQSYPNPDRGPYPAHVGPAYY
jgi:hypothetical protein